VKLSDCARIFESGSMVLFDKSGFF